MSLVYVYISYGIGYMEGLISQASSSAHV
jgi:hypothetical protein